MRIRLLLFSVLLVGSGHAQDVITTAGAAHSTGGYHLSWTIGEPISEFIPADNRVATQGLQQPDYRLLFGPPSLGSSTIIADPVEIPADGASTSDISVTLVDPAGRPIPLGEADVDMLSSHGMLTTVDVLPDGRYQATLTSPEERGSATIHYYINGQKAVAEAKVAFLAACRTFLPELTIAFPVFRSIELQAQQTIRISSIIRNNAEVHLRAGAHITLQPGFHAQPGTRFSARIEGCYSSSEPAALLPPSSPELPANRWTLYPNPAISSTQLTVNIPEPRTITVDLLDGTGKHLRTFINQQRADAGTTTYELTLTGLPAGIYWLHLRYGQKQETKKLIIANE